MKKSELRNIIREEVAKATSKQPINESLLGRLIDLFWTITGTKGALFNSIQSKYGSDANKYRTELDNINQRLYTIQSELEEKLKQSRKVRSK